MNKYANGIYFNLPNEKAPDFVIGKMSIQKEKFVEWLASEQANEKGYINLEILRSRDGKPYITVNEYRKRDKPETETDQNQITPDDLPF